MTRDDLIAHDKRTGEPLADDLPTDAELAARFESLGDLIDAADVPAAIRAGIEVWSYGYDADDPELFTTLDASDLWAFEPTPTDDPAYAAGIVESWAPFRADPEHREHLADHLAESEPSCRYCAALAD